MTPLEIILLAIVVSGWTGILIGVLISRPKMSKDDEARYRSWQPGDDND